MRVQGVVYAAAIVSVVFCFAVNCYTLRLTYPLWGVLDARNFAATHAAYMRLLTPVVTLPHIAMFFTTAALLRWPPATMTMRDAVLVFTLGTVVILISAFIAGPVHSRYTEAAMWDTAGQRTLLLVSAVRVALMLAAVAVVVLPIARMSGIK